MNQKIILAFILILAAALRLVSLDQYPFGLNADEAAIGYNAYSLLETGKDEHGVSWPLVFRSFDDFKPPVYFYLVLPFVKLLGLSIWAVRLPSAILGTATVYLLYLLTQQLFGHSKFDIRNYLGLRNSKLEIGIIVSFLLAISPWHLHFSRGGWEVNAATFFLALGLVAFFKGLQSPRFFLLSAVSFVLSMYTYHSMRVVVPLLGFYLLIVFRSQLFSHSKFDIRNYLGFRNSKLGIYLLISIVVATLLLIPLAIQTFSGSASSRFAGVSIFADAGPVLQANELRGQHIDTQSLLVRISHNRYLYYGLRFFNNLSKHYSDPFLFFTGDEIARSKTPDMGQSYLWTLPFFAVGLWFFAKNINSRNGLVLFWFLVGTIPAALTYQSPHALRAQNISLPLQIIIAVGISQVFTWLARAKGVLILILVFVSSYSLTRYLHLYYTHYPQQYGYAWQPGFDQLATYLQANQDSYDQVVISTRYDQPYILTAYFLKYPPQLLQQQLVFSTPDRFGFSTGLQFGKYHFRPINYDLEFQTPNTLLVVADESVPEDSQALHTISYPDGNPVFRLYTNPHEK